MSLFALPVNHAVHPSQLELFTTEQLRSYFLLGNLSKQDEFNFTYTHYDRLIVGTVIPVKSALSLLNYANLKSNFFLERREMGVINIGGSGKITIDGKEFDLDKYDCLYAGKGVQQVTFSSKDIASPAIFYTLSAPAHAGFATRLMKAGEASPVSIGAAATSNERTIYKYIHLDGIESCQLVMGLTILKNGSVWNTMPSHIHDRRSEIYLYFDVPQDQRVMHFMGEPTRTRNLVMGNLDAVLSPSWSIHSGCGTASYSFIWGMAGENKDYTDMDPFPAAQLI